jgi:type II secretory pathway component PulF
VEWRYVAYDQQGRREDGVMDAPDVESVRHALLANDLLPARVEKAKVSIFKVDLSQYTAKIKESEIAFLFRQLSSVVRTGLPLVSALSLQQKTSPNPKLKVVLRDLETRLRSGQALWESFAAHPKIFKPLYTEMLRSAERSGYTADALERIAHHIESASSLKKKIQGALVYPAIVGIMSTVGIITLIIVVLPKMKGIIEAFNVNLPLPTRIVMAVADFAEHNRLLIILVLALLVAVPVVGLQFQQGKDLWDQLKLKIPVLGRVTRLTAVASFARVLAEVMSVGLPMNEALDSLKGSFGNRFLAARFESVTPLILGGEGISRSLEQVGILPAEALQMIRIGEESGNVPQVASELSRFYEEEASRAVKTMTDMIEPLLISVLGGLVLFLALAIIAPIFAAYSNIS